MTRRELLAAGTAALVSAACTPALREAKSLQSGGPIRKASKPASLMVRRLNRAGFGPVPEDIERIESMGWEAYVDEQLAASIPEPPELQAMLHRLDIFNFGAADLRALPEREVVKQLQQAAILRAVYSPNQLKERMVEVWSDHFNIDSKKAYGSFYLATDQKSVIRENALGSFPAMLAASAKSPAMLGYLDNAANKSGVVNENYGRELLELHSLGVRGGYTQQDVRECARCFTGWTIETRFLYPKGSFRFEEEVHDQDPKELLGHRLPAKNGINDAEMALKIIAEHPSTARHIAGKIARAFFGSPDHSSAEEIAAIYAKTGGEIKPMVRYALLHDEFGHTEGMAKRPFDFLISSLRALDAVTDGSNAIQGHLSAMGQPLYQWAMPDGYPSKTSAWTASMLARWNFCIALAYGSIGGTQVQLEALQKRLALKPDEAMAYVSHGIHDLHGVSGSLAECAALALSHPQFQWK